MLFRSPTFTVRARSGRPLEWKERHWDDKHDCVGKEINRERERGSEGASERERGRDSSMFYKHPYWSYISPLLCGVLWSED